jgi:CCR4-NOT transcription complex subunit 3
VVPHCLIIWTISHASIPFCVLIWIAEIERVMKKVDEGVELFDEIWEKVYATEQQNQKEKYEMDLKKEIKKLQRLRDQIKTWIGSSDVKDKDDLIEARKLIETKMEQFKVCEKETKTKTYSKEGLARAERLDPTERAKMETETWIREYIDQLQQLVEDADVEIERLSAGKGKKTNKAQIDDLMHHVLQHKFHIRKLEGIIRLVLNDVLDVELVDPLKDDLDYYLDSNNDDDYQQAYDEDFFYESLGLDELDVVDVDRVTQLEMKKDAAARSDDESASTGQGGSKGKKDKKIAPGAIPLKIGRATVSKVKSAEEEKTPVVTPVKKVLAPPPVRPPPPPASGGASMAAILKREQDQEKERQQKALLLQVMP